MNIITKPRNKKYDSVLNLKAHSWGSLYTAYSSGFNAPALVPYSNSEIIDCFIYLFGSGKYLQYLILSLSYTGFEHWKGCLSVMFTWQNTFLF